MRKNMHLLQASLVFKFAKNRGRHLQMTRRRIYKLNFCLIKTRHNAWSAPAGADDLTRRCKVRCGYNLLSAPQNRSDRHATQGQDTMATRAWAQVHVGGCQHSGQQRHHCPMHVLHLWRWGQRRGRWQLDAKAQVAQQHQILSETIPTAQIQKPSRRATRRVVGAVQGGNQEG